MKRKIFFVLFLLIQGLGFCSAMDDPHNWNNIPKKYKAFLTQHLINLSFSKLEKLPEYFQYLSQSHDLKEIALANCGLELQPNEFAWICSILRLTSLDLSFNNLQAVDLSNIGSLKNLTSLDLSGLNLESLPLEISNLQELTTLHLCQNGLTEVPASIIKSLKNLEYLDLRYNTIKIFTVRESIDNPPYLTKLKGLNLCSNTLGRIDN